MLDKNLKNKEYLKSSFVVFFLLFLSSFLGLLRDRALTWWVGTGVISDLYMASFRIPEFLERFLILGVFGSSLLPYLTQRKREKYWKASFLGVLFIFSFLWIVVLLFTLWKTSLLFPGFPEEYLSLFRKMLFFVFLSQVFLALSFVPLVYLQYQRSFVWWASPPIFYNLGILLGIVLFYQVWGGIGLALGALLGSIFYCLFSLLKSFPFFKIVMKEKIETTEFLTVLRDIISLGWFGGAGFFLSQLLLYLYFYFGSFWAGRITIFSLAFNLQKFPVVLLGTAFSSVSFSLLSHKAKEGEEKLKEEAKEHLRLSFPLGLLSSVFLFFFSPWLALFLWSSLKVHPVILQEGIILLKIFSLFVPFFICNSIFHRFFQALGKPYLVFWAQVIGFIFSFTGLLLFLSSNFSLLSFAFSWGFYGLFQFLSFVFFFQKLSKEIKLKEDGQGQR